MNVDGYITADTLVHVYLLPHWPRCWLPCSITTPLLPLYYVQQQTSRQSIHPIFIYEHIYYYLKMYYFSKAIKASHVRLNVNFKSIEFLCIYMHLNINTDGYINIFVCACIWKYNSCVYSK
jgi:hypothetical protein